MKATHRRFSTPCIRAAIVLLAACSIATAQGVTFLGVAAGDATSNSVTLWAREQQPGVQTGIGILGFVSPDPTFSSDVVYTAGVPDPAHDFTIHFNVAGLKSGTRYYYRFLPKDFTLSQVGTFVTAPDPAARVPVRLGFTGDADGLMRLYDATNSTHFMPPGAPGFGPQSLRLLRLAW